MIQVLHISAECYPAAKTGGLGDVVGSLPKYMGQAGVGAAAVIPKYSTKWIGQRRWNTVYTGAVRVDWRHVWFSVQQEADHTLGFPFFTIDVPGLFDRPGIYADSQSGRPYGDEVERYLVFQQAVLQWLLAFSPEFRPRVLHCHDHHTGLIPFLAKHSPEYRQLAGLPTVFTIHNGQYQGMFSWDRNLHLLPFFDSWFGGLLDWNGVVNPMASAVRCAWAVTTVSETYLYELHESSMGLEKLFRDEWHKEYGIVNGIDAAVWDPRTDPMVQYRLEGDDVGEFKRRNKKVLCEWFGFPEDVPLISFIGRMVNEKGADLLPDTYRRFIHEGHGAAFLVLGTGEAWVQNEFRAMAERYRGRFNAVIDYNEALSHQIYAGSDYLIMPSRVEPCGLNQLYSMRYGTLPIVRSIGGLIDTVPDIADPGGAGRGIRFDRFTIDDCHQALYRAVTMWYNNPDIVEALRRRVMAIDFSWENTVEKYFAVYARIGARLDRPRQERLIVDELPPAVELPPLADAVPELTPAAEPPKPVEPARRKPANKPAAEPAFTATPPEPGLPAAPDALFVSVKRGGRRKTNPATGNGQAVKPVDPPAPPRPPRKKK